MRRIKPSVILDVVREVCNVDVVEVRSKCLKREIVTARHIYAYMAYSYGFQRIANVDIDRDPSTITYGKNKIEEYLQQPIEKELQQRVRSITQMLKPYAECMPCMVTGICKYENGFKININTNNNG